MKEDMVPAPEDPYGVAKYAVEMDLKCAHEMFGLNSIIFRPHNVYGEYQNLGDKYRNVVGIFMNQLMQGKELSVFGDGKQTRAFSYIGDVAPVMANAVNVPEAYNQVFNIGADREFTVNELAHVIQDAMSLSGKIRHLPPRNEVVHAYADHSKAQRIFRLAESTTLEDGITKMAAWAKEAGIRRSVKFKNIEVSENLPSFWLED
jgi:UDP-glucose 4-epimerase